MLLEELLPIQTIREHTKTDDNPRVTDDLIRLYRESAFEAAEKYTGMAFTPIRSITEPVRIRSGTGKIVLDHPVSGMTVTLYGGGLGAPVSLMAKQGSKVIHFPNGSPRNFQTFSDCHTCGLDSQLMATYETGRRCESTVPSGVIIGILKLIAWHISNPGDEIMSVRNTNRSSEQGLLGGTNNAAVMSGAVDEWYRYRRAVI